MNWKNLIAELIASGMTQVQIAEKAGCKQSSISDLQNGKTLMPNYSIGAALTEMHAKATKARKRAKA